MVSRQAWWALAPSAGPWGRVEPGRGSRPGGSGMARCWDV